VLGTRQVTFAVIATSLTLIAVFVPLSFLEGQVGRLFTEFGVVLAAAVAISMLVSLTLCPALSTKLLRGRKARSAAADLVERGLSAATRGYRALLARCLDAPILVLLVALAIGLSFGLYRILPQELTPIEDRVFFIPSTAAGTSATDAGTPVRPSCGARGQRQGRPHLRDCRSPRWPARRSWSCANRLERDALSRRSWAR
jgi:multidrug efflux pump